ncbi:MAG: hypothetical protein KBC02_02260 [Candidatus Pacebacteria bacterium]|nr:hypothetical protein [Candidatus Paceibacterota bacterium]
MDSKALVKEAAKRALKQAQQHPVTIGSLVASLNDEYIYELVAVTDGVASVERLVAKGRKQRTVRKQLPHNELFSVSAAILFAIQIGQE